MLRTACAIFAATLSSSAFCAFFDGNEMIELGEENPVALGMYVAGAADFAMGMHMVCVPNRAQVGQLRDVVIKYLDEHPEHRHYSADSIVVTALREGFPCESGPSEGSE